ncbi:MAG: Ig-like domain-containing protein [Clostridia bacterium]|nr:Ig-like domain-containing protein [Clostridia bacterium]
MKKRILSVILAIVMLFGMFATSAAAIVKQEPVYKESGTVEGKADEFPAIRDALVDYQVGETTTMANDGYIGIPVDITVYNDATVLPEPETADTMEHFYDTTEPNPVKLSKTGKPLVLYVINTNTTRYGTMSDVDIIRDLLAQGYVVMVVDYKNEKRANTPDLDWSLQLVRTKYATYTGALEIWKDYNYILPAGYSLKRGVQYFNYEMNGVDGILEYIMDIWNIDLKRTTGDYARGDKVTIIWGQKELYDGTKVYQDAEGNRCIPQGDGYAYYTQNADYTYTIGEMLAEGASVTPLYKKVSDDAVWVNEETREIKIRYAIAEDFWDCVKTNGDRIDMNLYTDIAYPTNPVNEVPVMMLASSSELRSDATQTATRPISTGFMFRGYAFVNYDHAYTPMARTDHFGYFEGEGGRRNAFTLRFKTGVQAQTAAVRQVRALADMYPELFKFDLDKIGAWGHSKGAAVNLLGTAHPELQPNEEYISGHKGECSGTQPWLTYQNGSAIPSGVNLVYSSNGGATYFIYEDNVPTVLTQGESDGNFTNDTHLNLMLNALRSLNVATFDMSMEGVGHTTVYGYNEDRDYDMYQALFDFCDYHLYGRASVCEYILPTNGTTAVDVKDNIIVKFTGSIPEWEIKDKVKVINTVTGESVDGWWESAYANNEWTFHPSGLEGGTIYTVLVPETLTDDNGNALKARKSVSFCTKFDTVFTAATVESTDGSFTLKGTEEGKNGIYFVFNPLNITHNFGTSLRFFVTNEASGRLRIYGVVCENADDYKNAPLGDAICEVGVTGRGIVEVDVGEYIASLPSGVSPVFYVEAIRESGISTVFESDFEAEDGRGVFASQNFVTSPNHTTAMRLNVGQVARINGLFGSTLTEDDLGRVYTITFDVYSTIDRPFHARVQLPKNNVQSDGKYFVDLYNEAHTLVYLKAGEWRTVTLTYRIDNPDYVKSSIQKSQLFLLTAQNVISEESVYIDNMKVTETVVDPTISKERTNDAIAPTLAVKNATVEKLAPVNGGYVVSGKYENDTFDNNDGYLVSGLTSGMQSYNNAVSYLTIDISSLTTTTPYAVALNVLRGEGAIRAYVIEPDALGDTFDIAKLNYLNAPALNRVSGTIDETAVMYQSALGSFDVFTGSDCVIGLTRAILDLKAQGKDTLVLAVVADTEKTSGEIAFQVKADSTSLETTINFLDFNEEAFTMATRRAENVYDTQDIYMQGSYAKHEEMENDGLTADSSIAVSGNSMKIVVPSGNYNVYKFLKLIESPERAFTTADVGKKFHVSFKLYLTSVPTAGFRVGLSTVAAGTSDGSAANKVAQAQIITNVQANTWTTVNYTFEVTSEMVGNRVSKITSDARPIHFCIQGLANTTMYVDDMRYYSVQESENTFRPVSRTENNFDSGALANKALANGFESFTDANGTKLYRVAYSTLENLNPGGSGSLRVLHNKSYNRFFLTGLIDTANITEENIGDTYTFIFRLKSMGTGTLNVDIAKKSHNASAISGMPAAQACVIEADDVGKWTTYACTFTVNQALVDDINSGTSNEGFGFRFRFSNFGVQSDGSVEVAMFIDNAVCYRNAIDDNGELIGARKSNSVTSGTMSSDNLVVSSPENEEGAQKAYFEYDLSTITNIHGATLSLHANEHQGQTFRLYGLSGLAFPETLTFLNAPANAQGAGMLLEQVYGAAPLADFAFDEKGDATVELATFIRENLGKKVIFVVVAEDGSLAYLNLNFALTGDALMESVTSDGEVALTDGKLNVQGTKVTFSGAFANGEGVLPKYAPICVSAIVSDGTKTYTIKVDGTAFEKTVTPVDNKITYTFTPDADTKVSTITITASGAGFTLSSLEITSPRVANLDTPVLNLYIPTTPTYAYEGVIVSHNIVIANSLSYNLYLAKDKGITSIKVGEKVFAFDTLRDYASGATSYKIFTLDTVAKDAFVNQHIEIVLADGSVRTYEINIQRYLEQFYKNGASEEEKALAANMISYLAESAKYFYENTRVANAAAAVRNQVLGEDYNAKNAPETLTSLSSVALTKDSGMQGAGLCLAERPTFYFVLADGMEDATPTFRIGDEVVSFETKVSDGKTYFILKHSPDTLYETVTYTIGDKSGAFNLRAYYDYAKENDAPLASLIERLGAYVESVNALF